MDTLFSRNRNPMGYLWLYRLSSVHHRASVLLVMNLSSLKLELGACDWWTGGHAGSDKSQGMCAERPVVTTTSAHVLEDRKLFMKHVSHSLACRCSSSHCSLRGGRRFKRRRASTNAKLLLMTRHVISNPTPVDIVQRARAEA